MRVKNWRSSEGGVERFELLRRDGGWLLRGSIVQGSVETRYSVEVNGAWETERAVITVPGRVVRLDASGGKWLVDGVHDPALDGCVDVDLSITPSTNTLPLRRLELPVGAASGPVRAAWVRFPALTVEVLSQEYRRLTVRTYQYVSRQLDFEAELEVDEDSLVVRYGDLWEALA